MTEMQKNVKIEIKKEVKKEVQNKTQNAAGDGMSEAGRTPLWDEAGVQAGTLEAFRGIVAALRSENGCAWDRAQTMESLKPCMINEMTEAIGAIDILEATENGDNLCEELGDVLLQIMLLAQIAEEQGLFRMEDVIRGISRKMIRRHPHVFSEHAHEMERKAVPGQWDAIKKEEKKNRTPEMERQEKDAFANAAKQVILHLQEKCRTDAGFKGNP